MSVVVAIALVVLFVVVLSLFFNRRKQQSLLVQSAHADLALEKVRLCPLCQSVLTKGQRVQSILFVGTTSDKIMEIEGCPYCYSKSKQASNQTRLCPVCQKRLADDERVFCRVFDRREKNKKTHVHILGCSRCRKR